MAASSATFHEAEDRLSTETRDMHRAIVSLMEELEAVDWYQQRLEATRDDELRDILRHNRNEEMEHAAMVLEWIRRRSPDFDQRLRPYLFTEGSILAIEDAAERGAGGAGAAEQGGDAAMRARAAGMRNGATPVARPYVTVGSLKEAR
jgi:ferritin-like protein